jgi:hypothetical protein
VGYVYRYWWDYSRIFWIKTLKGVIMAMSAVEKSIVKMVAPLIIADCMPLLKPILDKAMVSASPEIQAAESQLEAFILGVIPAILNAAAQ